MIKADPGARLRLWATALFLASAVALAFLPALRAGFLENWDDGRFILKQPVIRVLSASNLRRMFASADESYYQPVGNLSLALQYRLWGLNPLGYHLTNLALHLLNVLLFWAIARLLMPKGPGAETGAAFSALFFGVHPLRVESVAWLSEWRDVQAGLLFLGAAYCHLRRARAAPARRSSWASAIAALTFCCLLTKPMGVTLPFVLLLLDVYPLGRLSADPRRWQLPGQSAVIIEKWPLVAAALGQAAIVLLVAGDSGTILERSASRRLPQIAYGIGFYLWKTLVPASLSPVYERSWLLTPAPFVAYGLFGGCVVAASFCAARRKPALAAAAAYYLLTLLPIVGLLKVGRQTVGDRFSYLPCLSWALIAGAAVSAAWGRRLKALERGALTAALTAVLLGDAFLTWRQCAVWRDAVSLWSRAVAIEPENYFGHYQLAQAFQDAGLPEQASLHWIAGKENHAEICRRAGWLLLRRGDPVGAIQFFSKLGELKPGDPDVVRGLDQAGAASR